MPIFASLNRRRWSCFRNNVRVKLLSGFNAKQRSYSRAAVVIGANFFVFKVFIRSEYCETQQVPRRKALSFMMMTENRYYIFEMYFKADIFTLFDLNKNYDSLKFPWNIQNYRFQNIRMNGFYYQDLNYFYVGRNGHLRQLIDKYFDRRGSEMKFLSSFW